MKSLHANFHAPVNTNYIINITIQNSFSLLDK